MSEASPTDVAAGVSALPNIRDWRAQSQSFQDIAWYTTGIRSVDIPGFSDFIPVVYSSANLLTTLQVEPQLGRNFMANEDQPGHGDVVLINSIAWEKFFNQESPGGRQFAEAGQQDLHRHRRDARGLRVPVRGRRTGGLESAGSGQGKRGARLPLPDRRRPDEAGRLRRLRPQAELTGIQANISNAYPKLELDKRVVVTSYREVLTGNVRPALLALQFAVLAVWLIACANVASLLLSRTTGRRREIAIRSAIGAARSRLVRQFLTESLVLSLTGSAVGLALAYGCVRLLKFYLDLYLPLSEHIHIDVRVVAALVGFSVISAVLFGLLPAISGSACSGAGGAARGNARRRHRATLRNVFAMRWWSARLRCRCCC